jgi:hypothetical protein
MRDSPDRLLARPTVLLLCAAIPKGDHIAHVAHEDRIVSEVDEVSPLPQNLLNLSTFSDLSLQLFVDQSEVCSSVSNLRFHFVVGLPKRFFGAAPHSAQKGDYQSQERKTAKGR